MAYKIVGAQVEVQGRAVRVFTQDEEGNKSEVVLSADFCHLCVDDLATEFSNFMKEKGHPIVQEQK